MHNYTLRRLARYFRPGLIQAFVAGFALVLVAAAVAQETNATRELPADQAARATAKRRRAQVPFAKGMLTANDLLRRILKIKTEDGVRTFFYTDRTYIFRDKEKITADKLILGEIVAVRFDTDTEGREIVRRIKAYGTSTNAPPAKPESPK